MDPEILIYFWLIIAVIAGIGELVTAAFFLAPFAVGAAGAGIVAWAGGNFAWQLLTFTGASIATLGAVRLWTKKSVPSKGSNVGAERYHNKTGIVTETIDWKKGTGMVRMETEIWNAKTENDEGSIPAETPVDIIKVEGTKLVVQLRDLGPTKN